MVRNKEIGFIFQGFNLIANLTALENVELPLIYRGIDRKTRRKLAVESLKKVGLEKRMDHKPNEMSGGQQQRVAIARASHVHGIPETVIHHTAGSKAGDSSTAFAGAQRSFFSGRRCT